MIWIIVSQYPLAHNSSAKYRHAMFSKDVRYTNSLAKFFAPTNKMVKQNPLSLYSDTHHLPGIGSTYAYSIVFAGKYVLIVVRETARAARAQAGLPARASRAARARATRPAHGQSL